VLAFDAGHRLIDVGEDGALEQKTSPALLHDAAEDVL